MKQARGKKIFSGFVILVVILFAANYVTDGALGNVARTPAAAFWSTSGTLTKKLEPLQNLSVQKKTLRKERDVLQARVRELEIYALNNIVLSSENEELRRLLGTEKQTLNRGILARVLSRGGSFPYGTMIISREGSSLFTVGDLVFGEENIVVGTIAEVGGTNIVVKLISAQKQETNVFIGSGDRITQALVRGNGNGNIIAEVSRDAPIEQNDPVFLFGKETALVGFVGSIETQPTNALQTLRIRTPLNLETLRFVRVR